MKMGYVCIFQFWFPQGICLGVGFLGHIFLPCLQFPLLCKSFFFFFESQNIYLLFIRIIHDIYSICAYILICLTQHWVRTSKVEIQNQEGPKMDLPSSVHIETMSYFSLSCHSFYFFSFPCHFTILYHPNHSSFIVVALPAFSCVFPL